MFTNKTVLISGGTGSFGSKMLKSLLKTKIKEFNINKDKMVNDYNKFKSQELNNTLEKFNKKILNWLN